MKTLDSAVKKLLQSGTVIPAHPLALRADRTLDEIHQRLLTQYYLAAGAGGIAVGVHTTQFQIRDPRINLYEKLLRLAMEEVARAQLSRPVIKVAGVCGATAQAVQEARLAADIGYDMALLSPGGLSDWSEEALLERSRRVADVMPVFGFYLQPAVGGRVLSYDFWKAFAKIENVWAIKMAPFNRYQTLEVVRAVCHSGREQDIALYTGNDDNIIVDLLSTYRVRVGNRVVEKEIVGGLLGHWAVWTQRAVEQLERIKRIKKSGAAIPADLLSLNQAVTDANAAFFDAAHQFAGCIAGLHEVLQRQGLMKGLWCLDPEEKLSPGQREEIDRVYRDYPDLHDDGFVNRHRAGWLAQIKAGQEH